MLIKMAVGGFMSISLLLLFISLAVGGKNSADREKGTPFECGFDPWKSGRLVFSNRFFTLSVIFLVFDVEIALLLPLVVGGSGVKGSVWFALGALFILILLGGTFFEWAEGALDWKS